MMRIVNDFFLLTDGGNATRNRFPPPPQPAVQYEFIELRGSFASFPENSRRPSSRTLAASHMVFETILRRLPMGDNSKVAFGTFSIFGVAYYCLATRGACGASFCSAEVVCT